MTHCVDLEFSDVSNTDDYVNFVYEIWIMYLFDQEGGLDGSVRMVVVPVSGVGGVAALINTCA